MVLFGTLSYWVTGQYWGGTGWYLVVLVRYGAILVDTWCYLVSIGWYWLVLGDTGSVWGVTGWYLVVLDQYREIGDLVGCYHSGTTNQQTNKER